MKQSYPPAKDIPWWAKPKQGLVSHDEPIPERPTAAMENWHWTLTPRRPNGRSAKQ